MPVTGTGTATVTAKYGPAVQATAVVITGIQGFYVDIARKVLAFHTENSDPTSPQREFDLNAVATFTVVISGVNYTLTVS
jgi:hypothetical protein